jgi:hypothetical protein
LHLFGDEAACDESGLFHHIEAGDHAVHRSSDLPSVFQGCIGLRSEADCHQNPAIVHMAASNLKTSEIVGNFSEIYPGKKERMSSSAC